MNNPIEAFLAALTQAGIPQPKQPVRVSGTLVRFTPQGDHHDNGWYKLHLTKDKIIVGAFGCWKRAVNQRFCSVDHGSLTKEQWGEVHKAWKDAEEARKQEEIKNHAEVREKCQALFTLPPATTHPYLTAKGVRVHGQVVISNQNLTPGWLALPLTDGTGVIHTAQFIAEDGTKRFFYQGRKTGCWFNLASKAEGPIVIAEGYATGASVHEATGWSTVCAMDTSNLAPVAIALRKLHPGRTILFAADNDQFTEGNPGITKASAASKSVNGTVIYPSFPEELLFDKPTDFNDLHQLSGLGEVKKQLMAGAKLGGDWELLIIDARDTVDKVLPEPIQVIEGLLPEQAKLVIGGSSKTYKTWFTQDMSLSVGCGADFIGRKCLQRKVLYVNLELKETSFERRIQTIIAAKGLKLDFNWFYHISLRGLIARLSPKELVDRIVSMTLKRKCRLVVIDPIYKANTQCKDENAAGETTVFFNELDRIVTEKGASLAFDDHFSKGNQAEKDPLDAIRGSGAKGGDVDAAIILRRHKEESSFSVDVVHRELAPVEPFVLTWQYPLFRVNGELDPEDMKRVGGRPKSFTLKGLLTHISDRTATNPISVTEWAALAGTTRETLYGYMTEMRQKSLIMTVGEGTHAKQSITKEGRNLVTVG